MDSNIKGNVAEQAIVLQAMRLDIPVLRPVGEHTRCDLALDIGGRLWRVQCKWAGLNSSRDVVTVNLATYRRTSEGYVRTTYSPEEVDLFGIYCGELDRCFLIPGELGTGRCALWLRLNPARNGQRSCITLADDFDFEGAVAQLGRASRWQRAGQGFESPQLHSLSEESGTIVVAANRLRDRFGYWIDRAATGNEIVVTRHGKARVQITGIARPTADEDG